MKPKVSIIVPVYNVEKYLHRCMKSILQQTLKDIEVILVDDGSPDNCGKLCDDYAAKDKRIKVIHKKNAGLGFARNSGIELASGEYIAFVDSDDYISHTMYETLYNQAVQMNADACYCGYSRVLAKGDCKRKKEVEALEVYRNEAVLNGFLVKMLGNMPEEKQDFKMSMCVWRAIYSKELLDKYSISFHSEREYISEDIIFHLDFLKYAKCIVRLPEYHYYYCQNEDSLTGKYNLQRFASDIKLYNEIKRKMELLNMPEESYIRVDRLLLGRARTAIIQEIAYKGNSFGTKKCNIKQISMKKELTILLEEYPLNKLPFKQKIFFQALKHSEILLLYIIGKLHLRVK